MPGDRARVALEHTAAVAPLVAANALLFSLPAFFVLVMGSGVVLAGADHACAIGDSGF